MVQLARIRVHGFSAREVAVVRRLYLADMERAYIERDQALSDGLRGEYVQVSTHTHSDCNFDASQGHVVAGGETGYGKGRENPLPGG